jgi:hypothetical protein
MTQMAMPAVPHGIPLKVSMETNEAVDDLQVAFDSGKRAAFQAKRTISFSTLANAEFVSVVKQFVAHEMRSDGGVDESYYLVTSSTASKRITGDLLAALNAARDCSPQVFERDQPKAIVDTYSEVLTAILSILDQLYGGADEPWARMLLSKSYVIVLDIDPNSSLEQALVLALHAKGYAAPSEMWGKLVADCLEWARRRLTVDLSDIEKTYSHLKVVAPQAINATEHQYLRVQLNVDGFEVGRELVVARALNDLPIMKTGMLGLFEFYRFDDDCRPRLRFEGDRIILGSGDELELWGRFATWTGLNRYIDENIERLGREEVIVFPMNDDRDRETDLCAKTHRKALEAVAQSRDGTKCVHCELPVTASMSPVVEYGDGPDLSFGISHRECVLPTDRVMGRADSEMFGENPELVNFDVNSWFNAAHGGHGVFVGINASKQAIAPVIWGGIPPLEDKVGKYVVALVMKDGSEQLTSNRGLIQRFTKQHAEALALKLNTTVEQSTKDGDPLSCSDQTRAFGPRSLLVSKLGGSEKIQAIVDVRIRPYEAREAARYPGPRSWYAPLLILRESETLVPVILTNAIPAISDPLALGRHMENWRNAGYHLPACHLESLLTDAQVDQLLDKFEGTEVGVIIDPLFSEDGSGELVHGHPIYPLSEMERGQHHESVAAEGASTMV